MNEMLLNWMIFIPLIGGVICLLPGISRDGAKKIGLATAILTFALSVWIARHFQTDYAGVQFATAKLWIPALNVYYYVGLDGLSLPLVLLTTGLSILVVGASWSIDKATNAFIALYLFLMTGMLGVFLSLDLFLFYVFFEVSLLPMYFLIGIWGGPRKEYAAIKFFLYTLAGSICLLTVMLGFYLLTPNAIDVGTEKPFGINTWNLLLLQSENVRSLFGQGGAYWAFGKAAFWLTLIAFMIKLPAVPFHTWLPDAHVEAPTPISMILAGVLLKMGGYAMM